MKKTLKLTGIILLILLSNTKVLAQCTMNVSGLDQNDALWIAGSSQGTELLPATLSNCSGGFVTFGSLPDWITNVTYDYNSNASIAIDYISNPTENSRIHYLEVFYDNNLIKVITIEQGDACVTLWYPDIDGDGLGETIYPDYPDFGNGLPGCNTPNGAPIDTGFPWARNNNDVCLGDATNQCSAVQLQSENWIGSTTKDIQGNIRGKGRTFFNKNGKSTQTLSLDTKHNRVWATGTLYDSYGRPALQTLSAPTTDKNNGTAEDLIATDLIKNASGASFSKVDFETDVENPATVASNGAVYDVGRQYSTNNADEVLHDVTDRPYARTIYSELNPGTTLRTIGGNKIDGEWKQGFSYTFPVAQELYYVFGKDGIEDFGDLENYEDPIKSTLTSLETQVNWLKATKSVSQDIHGIESVVFTDTDGKTLAAARSGGGTKYPVLNLIGEQGFVDVHIPIGCENSLTFVGATASDFKIYNLRTEEVLASNTNVPAGFYRVEYIGTSTENLQDYPNLTKIVGMSIDPVFTQNIGVQYFVNYYDYSLNYYDKAGRLLKSTQPLGFDATALTGLKTESELNHTLASTFEYNALGQLLKTTSPDEGTANFKYREDGQIRFSQNSKQLAAGEFSYTNYDELARPVESGVATGNFSNLNPDDLTFTGTKKIEEKQRTFYDDPNDLYDFNEDNVNDTNEKALSQITGYSNYHNQKFIAGNVAKTMNENTTTWYSYDIYGRVEWVFQYIKGLGAKTIDYEYDPVTSAVLKVDFQKHVPAERFIHKYTYHDVSGELLSVATSENGTTFTEQAKYDYYETGELKRTELQKDNNGTVLQGIDYTYNLAGQLKAINDPTLANDPGGDTDDAFGMQIDYYTGDYLRNNQFQSTTTNSKGIEQYNGNIKAITWNTRDANGTPKGVETYYYKYNKNNWLEAASFSNEITEATTEEVREEIGEEIAANVTLEATYEVTMKPGFASNGHQFTAAIVEDPLKAQDYNVYGVDYDANGNIQRLNRNKDTENNSNEMDKLSYAYKEDKPNQLLRVDDAVTATTNAQDIKDQDGDNYVYNSIGQLVENIEESVKYVYTASGLVSEVQKNDVSLVKFFYNDKGFRVRKESFALNETETASSLLYTEYYTRDVAGSVMAIYRKAATETVALQQEIPIYGASRLGVYYKIGGHTNYQLTDHLGNVRAVVTKTDPNPSIFADYYPGGMQMPNRNVTGDYRYGYQGEYAETDPETGKPAFQLRLYDPRINRWLTTDPAGQYASPYLGMGNNPINGVDPDGAYFIIDDFLIGAVAGLFNGEGFFQSGFERASNSVKIYGGLFQGGLEKTVSRFTKELPQTVLGLLSGLTVNTFLDYDVDYFEGATFVSAQKGSLGDKYSYGAFTLGSFVTGDSDFKPSLENHIALHEYGHYLQSQKFGLSYLGKVAIPSFFRNLSGGNWFSKKGIWTEEDANTRSAIYMYSKHGHKWNSDLYKNNTPYGHQYSRLLPGVSAPHLDIKAVR